MAGLAEKLSDRQRDILNFIIEFVTEEKYPPTIREIGKQVQISSTSVVNYNLKRLEEEELITRRKEKSRGLALNWGKLLTEGLIDESQLPGVAIRIPVLGAIAAGEPIQVIPSEANNADDYLEVTEAMLGDARNTDKLYALRVQGDSMIDASVMDGDVVILRHQERAENGEMVAAWLEENEETTLKYWYADGKRIRLQPANPNYNPILCDPATVHVQGKVVGVYRSI
ncbi:MAG: transcriptional repressor LexA [Caldilineaceae bacterium]|nr:transcriptional repressor LexA [Caldilineaceae bacterium]